MSMPRLFFALRPDKTVRDRLAEVAELLPDTSGHLVRPENFHITLVFQGSVDADIASQLSAAANGLKSPGFSLLINQSGWWSRPGVAWLAPDNSPDALPGLVEKINQLLITVGRTPESRPWQPHLTIARAVRRPVNNPGFESIHWNINDFCLVESISHAEGVRYKVRQSWPLS